MKKVGIKTTEKREVVDITDLVEEYIEEKFVGQCFIFVAHTTCALTTADLDPGTDLDLLDSVWEMIPKIKFRHPHNPSHTPAHIASSIIGTSLTVPVENGQLVLGEWQRIVLVEFDGPRQRNICIDFR